MGIEIFIVMVMTTAIICMILLTVFGIAFMLKWMHLMEDIKKYAEIDGCFGTKAC